MRRELARWRNARILLVEDDPGDQEIARRALARDGYQADLHMVTHGEQAIDYLLRQGPYADARGSPRPDLVILDLNLPGLPGKRVLEVVKSHKDLRQIPEVVVTTSARDQDVAGSYQLGCSSYLVKPLEAHRFIEELRQLYDYWFGLVTLPAE